MFLKHIVRVNATHIMCTQYELQHDEFKRITSDPSCVTLAFVYQSMRHPVPCYRCSSQCDWSCKFKRKTDLLTYEETDTYIKDDICIYCSKECFMCDSQGVVDVQTQ
jgi:hypothetical protein